MSDKTINYPVTPQPELSLDSKPMAESLSVTIASDQTPVPVSGTFTFSNPSIGENNTSLPTSSTLAGANDAGIIRPLDVTRSGGVSYLKVDTSGYLSIGAATSSLQTTGNNSLSSIDGKIPVDLTVTSNKLLVDGSGVTQPISAASLPLPSGAATESTLNTINGKLPALTSNGYLASEVMQIDGVNDSTNSTTTNLGSSATYTGSWKDITNYNAFSVGVYADQDSATDGLMIQFSHDASNIDHIHYYTYLASTNGIGYNLTSEFRYYRIVYINGSVAQTRFALTSILRPTALFPSMYKITNTLTDYTQAIVTRSVITGQTTGGGGGYVNVKVNPSGALVTDSTVSGTVAATQSGTWNINNISGTISLPTLAATSTKQSDGSQKTQIVDGSGNVIAATSNALNVNIQNTSIQAKAAVNLNGSGSGAGATVSTVITLTAPSNTVGFILMNMDTSTANIRYAIGRTASATLGQQLQPGRDTGFIPCGANISLCAESGTQTYDLQWVSQ